jgi:hypothetical protein
VIILEIFGIVILEISVVVESCRLDEDYVVWVVLDPGFEA